MSDTNPTAPAYEIVRLATGRQYSVGVAYLWFCFTFVGLAGFQHFYLGNYVRGTFWLFTWGLFGIGSIYDLFALGAETVQRNERNSRVVAMPME